MKEINPNLFFLLILWFLLSGNRPLHNELGIPTIKAGACKITGSILRSGSSSVENIIVNFTVPMPISGEYVKYKVVTDQAGRFSLDVDLETETTITGFYTSLNPEKSLLVKLTNGRTSSIVITLDSLDVPKEITASPAISANDMLNGLQLMNKMMEYSSGRKPEVLYNKSTEYFLNHAKTVLSERLNILEKDSLISNDLKNVLAKDFRLYLYIPHVFNYEKEMLRNYKDTKGDPDKEPKINNIDRSYFSFLKDFELNNPSYLYCFTFPEFQKEMLQNPTLALPPIGETDLAIWMAHVKKNLTKIVGFGEGQYYEILAANALSRQLNEELRPFSNIQKGNIERYWGKSEIAKILFRKNNQVVKLDKFKIPLTINDVTSIAEDKILDAILSKNKSKVVFIDLWATWCVPCLEAMKEFRTTKIGFNNKDVSFVYLTNSSSPKDLWDEKIKGIGGEHYYLNKNQWTFMMNNYGFEYIPSYLLFNKDGKLISKFSAYPGSEKMKYMIDELLQ